MLRLEALEENLGRTEKLVLLLCPRLLGRRLGRRFSARRARHARAPLAPCSRQRVLVVNSGL